MKKIITTLTTLVLLAPCGAQSLQKGKDYGVISGKLDFSAPNQKMRLIHNDKLFIPTILRILYRFLCI